MLQNRSTEIRFHQGQLAFDEQTSSHHQPLNQAHYEPHRSTDSESDHTPKIHSKKDYQTYILKVKPLTPAAADRVRVLSSVVQQSFQQRRTESAGFILSKFSASLIEFWEKRYSQYSSTERFIKRVARVFNLTDAQVRVTQKYYQLPDCMTQACRTLDNTRFATCLYLDANETVRDPLENYYSRTITKASTLHAWDQYLNDYAFLTPDMLNPSDIRYLLKKYPMPVERAAMLLQVKPDELAEYAEAMDFPLTYHTSAVPIRDLIGHEKHQRLTAILLNSAHALYTHQAIPLRIIAERIGVDVGALFEQGEKLVGDWIHPHLNTIHHVIEITTLIHVEAGGVLRQNAS